MGLTLAEKILAAHADRESVAVGDTLEVPYDVCFLSQEDAGGLAPRVGERVASQPERVVVIEDRLPVGEEEIAARARANAMISRLGLSHVALGRGGVARHELVERGHATPGRLVVGIDRALPVYGALGAFGWRTDADAAADAIVSGRVKVTVPPTLKLTLRGVPGRWASGNDVAMSAVMALQGSDLDGRAVEIDGETIARMEMCDRLRVAQMVAELGPSTVFTTIDETSLTWLRARSAEPMKPWIPDQGATYEQAVVHDVDRLEPVVALPGGRDEPREAKRITALPSVPVDLVVIGGTAGGRIEDLRGAAKMLKEHPVHPRVRLLILPATQKCIQHAIAEGLVSIFLRSGAVVHPPLSGVWEPELQALGAGERCVATGRANRPGEHGVAGSEVFLASATVAAASAVMGRIAHPDEVLRSRREAV